MRLLKWLLIGFFALLVAVLVAGYVTLTNFPVEDLKALIEEQTEKATGRKLTIAGDVSMEVSLSPSIVMEEVSLANASWAGKEPMVTVKRLELELALLPLLSSEVAVERLALIEPKVDLARDASGKGNWVFGSAKDERRAAAEALPSFKDIVVRQAVVTLQASPGAKERHIEIESLNAGAGGLDEALSGELKGTLDKGDYDLFFQLGSMRQMLVEGRFPIFLQGHLAGAEVQFDGSVEGEGKLAFTLGLKAKRLDQLQTLLDRPLPAIGPLAFHSKIATSPTGISFDELSLSLADSEAAGRIEVDLSGAKPKVTGALTAKQLASQQLLSGPWDPGTAVGEAKLVPDVAFPMELLDQVDLSMDLDVESLTFVDGSQLSKLKTKADLQDRALTLSPLTFDYSKGRFDGSLHVNRRQGRTRFETKGDVKGLDYGPLLGLPLRGQLDATWEFAGEGDALRAMVGSMRGRTRATSSDTVVRDGFLAFLGEGLTHIFQPLFGGGNALTLTCLVSDLKWYGGTARSEATAIAGDTFVSTISGTVDILGETMDLYVDTSGRGVNLSALVVPVRISGPLAEPTILPDPARSVLNAAEVAGMVLFPPLLAVDLLDLELRKLNDPKKACAATVKTIEASGGISSLVARWAQKSGDPAVGVLKDATDAASSVGEAIGQGVGAAGGAVEEGLKDATDGVKSLFGN